MDKAELIAQTKNAFDFIQKLYLEVSYLIKEVEGLLGEEEERFIIGRTSGYSITTRSSTGLEPNYVRNWLWRNMAVFYVPEKATTTRGGQTFTDITPTTKVIYLRAILDDHTRPEPVLVAGVLYDFHKISVAERLEKLEKLMAHIEYRSGQVFRNIDDIQYSDTSIQFRGCLFEVPLFDLQSSDDLQKKVVQPALALFRDKQPIFPELNISNGGIKGRP
jgi:hypothetical protein